MNPRRTTIALCFAALFAACSLQAQESSASDQHYFLIRLSPVRGMDLVKSPTADEQKILGEHAAYLKKLMADGKLLVGGPSITENDALGIAIVEAPDEAAARELLENDPSVKGNVFKGDVRPFRLAFYRK